MGLSAATRKRIKELLANAPEGTLCGSLEYVSQADRTRRCVIPVDMMASPSGMFTWCKPNTKPSDDVPMTGYDYWIRFEVRLKHWLSLRPMHLIITADDRKLVPVEKAETQEKRFKHSKITEPIYLTEQEELYGDVFTDWGIKAASYNKLRNEAGLFHPVPLPPSLCRGSSHLRKPLCRYFIQKVVTWIRANWTLFVQSGTQSIVFDYDGLKYTCIKYNKLRNNIVLCKRAFPKRFPIFGEADGKIVAWSEYYMMLYNTVMETTDSDLIGWSTGLAERYIALGCITRIHWVNQDKITGKLVVMDLIACIDYLLKSLHLRTPRDLLVWMIKGGTDFWPKDRCTYLFGIGDLLESIRHPDISQANSQITFDSYSLPQDSKHDGERNEMQKQELVSACKAIVLILSKLKYTSPCKIKNKPTTKEQYSWLSTRLMWHIGYWEADEGIANDIIRRKMSKQPLLHLSGEYPALLVPRRSSSITVPPIAVVPLIT